MNISPGQKLRAELACGPILPAIGVYDAFSASIAARHYDAIFLSGFGFAASYYGLPDRGYIAWSDIVGYVQRVRTILPQHLLIVDIDDGYGDADVACHVVSLLEGVGAAGVVLEDQKRPRRCGHLNGKEIMELDEYLAKLKKVLAMRKDLVVVARTDAAEESEIEKRLRAFAAAGADVVLADGLRNLQFIARVKPALDRPVAFNQMAGGKSPPCALSQLQQVGVSLVIYSTPCLFAAQAAMDEALKILKANDGSLQGLCNGRVVLKDCAAVLEENLAARDRKV